MQTFNKRILGLIVIGLVVIIAACGGNTGSGNNDGNGTTSPSSSTPSAGQNDVELKFMTTWTETDAFTGVYYKNALAFMEQNPHITIEFEIIPYNDYLVKLNTSAIGNQLPDLMLLISGGTQIESLVRSGKLMPIDEIMDTWSDELLPRGRIQQFNFDGKQYAIPGEISYGSTIFYNKKILSDAGYEEFPSTFAEFKQMGETLKSNGITPIAIGNKTGNPMQMLLSQVSGRISDPNLFADIMAGNKNFTDSEFVAAIDIIKELYDSEFFNIDLNNIENDQATDLFVSGRSAMFIDGNWFANQIIQKKPDDMEVGFAVFPQIEGGVGSMSSLSSITNQGVGINANLEGDKKAAALEFIKFMYSEESNIKVNEFGSIAVANVEIPVNEDPLLQERNEVLSKITDLTPAIRISMPPNVATAISNGMQGLTIRGGPSAEEVANAIQSEVN